MSKYFIVKKYESRVSRGVLFLFPAGFTRIFMYRYTIWSMNRMGIDVVAFQMDWKNAVEKAKVEDLMQLMVDANQEVSKIISNKKHQFYATLGISFGGVISMYITNRHQEINRLILVVPHAILSKVLWTFKPTAKFKQRLIENGIKSDILLKKIINDVEPLSNLSNLKGKRIINFTATEDTIVLDGALLAEALKAVEPDTININLKNGHFFGGIRGVLSKKTWGKILA